MLQCMKITKEEIASIYHEVDKDNVYVLGNMEIYFG